MVSTSGAPSQPPGRRLTRDVRRAQLLAAAMPLVARQGFADFSLEGVSTRAGVTRNLLYHYFPRGRTDVALAVVQEARRQLIGSGQPYKPLPPQMLDHALARTHAWRIYRLARTSADPEIRAVADGIANAAARALAPSPSDRDPSPMGGLMLRGYLAFAESVLDDARAAGVSRPEITRLLSDTLEAIPVTNG